MVPANKGDLLNMHYYYYYYYENKRCLLSRYLGLRTRLRLIDLTFLPAQTSCQLKGHRKRFPKLVKTSVLLIKMYFSQRYNYFFLER